MRMCKEKQCADIPAGALPMQWRLDDRGLPYRAGTRAVKKPECESRPLIHQGEKQEFRLYYFAI